MSKRSRKMRGGLFGFGTSDNTGTTATTSTGTNWWGSSYSNSSGTSWWDKLTGKKQQSSYGTPSYGTQTNTGYGYGGRKHKKHMKGGFTSNRAGGLATYAAPISGVKNAQPQNWVGGPEYKGGRTRKCRGGKHRHSKSCKHRKH